MKEPIASFLVGKLETYFRSFTKKFSPDKEITPTFNFSFCLQKFSTILAELLISLLLKNIKVCPFKYSSIFSYAVFLNPILSKLFLATNKQTFSFLAIERKLVSSGADRPL